ncbi:MAG: LysM peptidoglycan-binding domain-containing protein [Clostridia bacterium]|nr:LysM peptidoglycan-binding domain-containing protein [Clostridia bacterium]
MINVYKVQKGETFLSIARKFNVNAEGLKHDNNFQGELFEGARIIIRPSKAVYTVKPFEKLSDIALKLNVNVQKLMDANYLKKPFVFAGQVLIIPSDDE